MPCQGNTTNKFPSVQALYEKKIEKMNWIELKNMPSFYYTLFPKRTSCLNILLKISLEYYLFIFYIRKYESRNNKEESSQKK